MLRVASPSSISAAWSASAAHLGTAAFAAAWILARHETPLQTSVSLAIIALAAWIYLRKDLSWPALGALLLGPGLAMRDRLYDVNPYLANVTVYPVLVFAKPFLVPVAIAALALSVWRFWQEQEGTTELWQEKRMRWANPAALLAMAAWMAGYPSVAIPLFLLACGFAGAVPAFSPIARWARFALNAALSAMAVEFLFSMRL